MIELDRFEEFLEAFDSNPFKINIEGGKKTLHVIANSSRPNPVFDMDKGCKVSDVIDNVDEVACAGWLNITGDKDIREYIASVISADKITAEARVKANCL